MNKAVMQVILFGIKRNPALLRWFLLELIKAADIQTLAAATFKVKDRLRGK